MTRRLSANDTALLALTLVAIFARLWLGPFVADDAYITFRYARNLAAGAGFTFNPPAHVLGTTTPLFTLIMTVPAALGWDPGWSALAIATAADVVTILCGAVVLARRGWPLAALFYAACIALWPAYITSSVSGMETSLYVALLALAWLAVDREKPLAAAVALAFAVLCRPDALLASVVVLGWTLRRSPRTALHAAALSAALIVPWVLFSIGYFHTIVPASLTAKAHARVTAGQSLMAFLARFAQGIYLLVTPIATVGAALLLRRGREVFVAGAVWWILYAAAFIVTGAFSYFPWYFVPLLPLYLAALGAGVEGLTRLLVPARAVTRLGLAIPLAASAFLLFKLPHDRETLNGWFAGREFLYERVATRELRGTHCTLAATEIGTLGYFYPGPVLDLVGLVSPGAVGRPVLETIAAERPCWVATYDDHIDPTVLRSTEFRERHELVFSRRLGPTREFLLFRRRDGPASAR